MTLDMAMNGFNSGQFKPRMKNMAAQVNFYLYLNAVLSPELFGAWKLAHICPYLSSQLSLRAQVADVLTILESLQPFISRTLICDVSIVNTNPGNSGNASFIFYTKASGFSNLDVILPVCGALVIVY